MMKKIINFCFIYPLIFNILNLQGFISLSSISIAQFFAYLNLAIICIGIILNIKNIGNLSKINKLWGLFYLFYYGIGFISGILNNYDAPIAKTLVPVTYFLGFYYFLSTEYNRKLTLKVITYCLVISCILLIILFKLNFSLDHGGIHVYKIDRAEGIYGDANNSALVCILAYLFFNIYYVTKSTFSKILKTVIIFIIFYSLFLTFSTTGLVTFIVVLFLNNLNFFKGGKLILFVVAIITSILTLLNLKSITSGLELSQTQTNKIDNLTNLVTLNTDKVDNSGRNELAQNLIKHINENPLLGNGIDFSVSIRGHNTYLGVWGDSGVTVFILFCFILVVYIVKSLKSNIYIRYFCLSTVITLCIFMASLQTVINQGYLMVIFVYIGYLIDTQTNLTKSTNYD